MKRFRTYYERVKYAGGPYPSPIETISGLADEEVVYAAVGAIQKGDRKLAEILAMEVGNRVRRTGSALTHLAEGVLALNDDGTIKYANPAAEELLGWAPGELTDRGAQTDVFPPPGEPAEDSDSSNILSVCRTGEVVRVRDTTFRRKDGSTLPVAYSAAPITYENHALGIVLLFRDITERKRFEEELLRFKTMSDHANDAHYLVNGDGNFAYVNKVACMHLGYDEDELLHMGVRDVNPEYREGWVESLFEKIADERVPPFEVLHKRKDGSTFPVEISVATVTLGGEPHLFATARDVTRRKRDEEALRLGKERFRLVARATEDVVWDYDIETDHLWWSENFQKAFGYGADEVGNTFDSWAARVHPDDRARVEAGIQRWLADEDPSWRDEYRFRRADGTYADVLDRAYAVRDRNGKAVRALGSMMDLTARKRQEEHHNLLETILRSTDNAILVADANRIITRWNAAAEAILGYAADEIVGRSLDVLQAEHPAEHTERYERVLNGASVHKHPAVHLTKDGRRLPVSLTISPLRDGDGRVIGMCAIIRKRSPGAAPAEGPGQV